MGGLGWSALDNAAALEEFTSACMGGAANILFNTFGLLGAMVECKTGIVLSMIKKMIIAQQKGAPLFYSWAITEPGAGTDMEDACAMKAMRPSCRAQKVQGGYSLNGTKCFITNGSLAHYVIVNMPADPDRPLETMAAFHVPADAPGFSVGRVERKCGQKASQTAELFFDRVFVPDAQVWARARQGIRPHPGNPVHHPGLRGLVRHGNRPGRPGALHPLRRKQANSPRPLDRPGTGCGSPWPTCSRISTWCGPPDTISPWPWTPFMSGKLFDSLAVKGAARLPNKLLLSESLRFPGGKRAGLGSRVPFSR